MGVISIGTAIGNYRSPLATIRKVVTTKSTASMPFTMCLMWIVYGLVISDMFVLIPNAIQLVLYAIYPSNSSKTLEEVASVMIDPLLRFDRQPTRSVIVIQGHPGRRPHSQGQHIQLRGHPVANCTVLCHNHESVDCY
ncbi:hypothetical protein V7S43_010651 [Phytophthora oleae]|uniref:Amino acid transporter n=1 Tax=Phytophthora oleae TaxID=2107226 RepID=A0ABD3FD19_9STRA